jgi:chemotaxis regulatin CheY-phosphate phosphatase CheZ
MADSVEDLVAMARALSEGEFDREFGEHFQGELGQLASYLDAVRQTLKSISSSADSSTEFIPEAKNGVAEIYQHAEVGVNSILDLVDHMSADQEQATELLAASSGRNLDSAEVLKLQKITESTRHGLMGLIGYLSFQDVLRQRVERVQELIENLEARILELLGKFKMKANGNGIPGGTHGEMHEEAKDRAEGNGLDQALIDELLESLK